LRGKTFITDIANRGKDPDNGNLVKKKTNFLLVSEANAKPFLTFRRNCILGEKRDSKVEVNLKGGKEERGSPVWGLFPNLPLGGGTMGVQETLHGKSSMEGGPRRAGGFSKNPIKRD